MSSIVGLHLRMRKVVDSVIAREDAERRRLAKIVLQRARGFNLLAFKAADTHLHLDLADSDRRRGIELCRRIGISWGRSHPAAESLTTLPPKPIEDQWHLHNTFNYILDQEKHHRCEADRYHEASMLPDLLGLRVTGAYLIQNVRAELPRVRWADLLQRLGPVELERPISSLDGLADAAAAAMTLPDLSGMTRDQVDAKRAAVHVASPHLSALEIADLLMLSKRRVEQIRVKIKDRPVEETLARALELQLRFRSQMAEWLRCQKPEQRAWPDEGSGRRDSLK